MDSLWFTKRIQFFKIYLAHLSSFLHFFLLLLYSSPITLFFFTIYIFHLNMSSSITNNFSRSLKKIVPYQQFLKRLGFFTLTIYGWDFFFNGIIGWSCVSHCHFKPLSEKKIYLQIFLFYRRFEPTTLPPSSLATTVFCRKWRRVYKWQWEYT